MIDLLSFIIKRMFLFGHIGITLGAAALVNGLVRTTVPAAKSLPSASSSLSDRFNWSSFNSWFESLGKFLDIRLLIMGSLLPDIIDKPLAYIGNFGSGRALSHTLLFFLLLLAAALYLYISRRRTWLLALAAGVFAHLILDSMWQNPYTLYWPVYGWIFPPREAGNVIIRWIAELTTNRAEEAFELVGLLIFALFLWTLIHRGRLVPFLIFGDPEKPNSRHEFPRTKKIQSSKTK
jgi:inner membrane protein